MALGEDEEYKVKGGIRFSRVDDTHHEEIEPHPEAPKIVKKKTLIEKS